MPDSAWPIAQLLYFVLFTEKFYETAKTARHQIEIRHTSLSLYAAYGYTNNNVIGTELARIRGNRHVRYKPRIASQSKVETQRMNNRVGTANIIRVWTNLLQRSRASLFFENDHSVHPLIYSITTNITVVDILLHGYAVHYVCTLLLHSVPTWCDDENDSV